MDAEVIHQSEGEMKPVCKETHFQRITCEHTDCGAHKSDQTDLKWGQTTENSHMGTPVIP